MSLSRRRGAHALVFLFLWVNSSFSQDTGDACLSNFKRGKEDFVLDTDESVKNGATFITPPKVSQEKECVAACCKEPKCNLAFMKRGDEEDGSIIESCFLFDCLYKNKYACHFVKQQGFTSYITKSVYNSYISVEPRPTKTDTPPEANAGLDLVVQPGETVTLNGFQSKDDHTITSFEWEMITEYPHAVLKKTNLPDQLLVSNLTSGRYKFKLTVTDNIGQKDSTVLTVLVLTPQESEHHCMAPKKIGPCRGSFPRWHYNAASQKCEQFIFGGCRENRNNYLSEEECKIACSSSRGTGPGSRGIFPTKAASNLEKCGSPCSPGQFTCSNNCCLEEGYECDGTNQCSDGSDEVKCEKLTRGFSKLLDIQINEKKARCTAVVETGTCRDTQTMWYYDPYKQKCFRFNYGGCDGNENRFDSLDNCKAACTGITEKDVVFSPDVFERSTGGSNNGTIIAIILGVAIAVMLVVLGCCCYKYRNKKGKKGNDQLDAPNPWSGETSRHIYKD